MSEELTQNTMAAVRDKDAVPGEGRFKKGKRRKVSYLTINKIQTVDYKEVNILRRFISDRGKMIPSRQTGNTAKQQRMIARAIRRARELALLPFVVTDMTVDTRGPRRDRGDRGDRRGYDRGPAREVEAAPVEAPVVETPAAESAG
jgi:small subunit ribosomal protein S18